MTKLNLSDENLLGSGNERLCYIYPQKKELCVKVNRPGVIHRSQNKIEYYYFNKLIKKNIPFTHIPNFYGKIETNFGSGLVFERIINSDQKNSERLDMALKTHSIDKKHAESILKELYSYFYRYGICIGDINTNQILLKNIKGKIIPIVIDGLGTRRYGIKLFLLSNFKFLARRKLKKSWSILLKELNL